MFYSPPTGIYCPPSRGVERYSAMPAPSAARRRMAYSGADKPIALPGSPIALYYSDLGVYSDTAMTTPQSYNSGPVQAWADQSGNGNHLVNQNSVSGTYFFTYLTNQLNGYPCVQAGPGATNAWFYKSFTLNTPITVYVVALLPSGLVNNDALFDGYNTWSCILEGYTGNKLAASNQFSTQVITVTSPASTTAIVTSVFNGASSLIQINNGAPVTGIVTAQNPGGFTLNGWGASGGAGYLGAGLQSTKYVAVAVYSGAHNSTQIAQAIGYLDAKYQVY